MEMSMAFLRLSIARRALLSFGLIALLVLLQGLFALQKVAQVRATGQHTENVSLPQWPSTDRYWINTSNSPPPTAPTI
jgi:hypothetical protein